MLIMRRLHREFLPAPSPERREGSRGTFFLFAVLIQRRALVDFKPPPRKLPGDPSLRSGLGAGGVLGVGDVCIAAAVRGDRHVVFILRGRTVHRSWRDRGGLRREIRLVGPTKRLAISGMTPRGYRAARAASTQSSKRRGAWRSSAVTVSISACVASNPSCWK